MRVSAFALPTDAAAFAAISVATLKQQVRVEHTDEDSLLSEILIAAFDHVDRSGLGFALRSQTWDYQFDGWGTGGIRLPVWPVQSVAVTYLDTEGATQTLAADQYRLIPGGYPPLIVPARNVMWPAVLLGPAVVRGRVVCGHADPIDMPRDFLRAILLLAAHWYDNREAVARNDKAEIPFGVQRILDRFASGQIA